MPATPAFAAVSTFACGDVITDDVLLTADVDCTGYAARLQACVCASHTPVVDHARSGGSLPASGDTLRPTMTNPAPKPQRLTEDEVRRVATLCRIGLTDEEVERLRDEMPGLIAEVSVLQAIDTSNVEATGHAVEEVHTVMRDDVPRPAMTVEETLSNAPRRQDDYFRVPQVMDDGQG